VSSGSVGISLTSGASPSAGTFAGSSPKGCGRVAVAIPDAGISGALLAGDRVSSMTAGAGGSIVTGGKGGKSRTSSGVASTCEECPRHPRDAGRETELDGARDGGDRRRPRRDGRGGRRFGDGWRLLGGRRGEFRRNRWGEWDRCGMRRGNRGKRRRGDRRRGR